MDTTGGPWSEGRLADTVGAGVTSGQDAHGGQGTTLMALDATVHHRGSIVVAPGYTSERGHPAGGNPYGASSVGEATEAELDDARCPGERVATVAARLAG